MTQREGTTRLGSAKGAGQAGGEHAGRPAPQLARTGAACYPEAARPPGTGGKPSGRGGRLAFRHGYPRDLRVALSRPAASRARSRARSAATRPPQTPCLPMPQCRRDNSRQWPRTRQPAHTAIAAAAS